MLRRVAARLRHLGAARRCSSQTAWVAAWGNNDKGRLGLGVEATNVRQPQRVLGLPDGVAPLAVSAGGAHTLVLLSSGEVFGCGLNDWAQLGSGDLHVPRQRLVAVMPTEVVRISAGSFHNLAVTQDGCLWAWGRNTEGQLGLGPNAPSQVGTPTLVPLDEPIVDVAAGSRHSLAVSHSGQLYAFGARALLGLGGESWRLGTSIEPEPRLVRSLRGVRVRAIATGSLHSAVACEDGHVYTFGEGAFAQLGTGGSDRAAPEPMRVPGLSGVAQLACGGLHTMALTRGGTLYSWGTNEHGALGLGDIEGAQQRVPSLLPDVSLAQVSCGWKHNGGVSQTGQLFAWGWGGSQGEDTGSSGGQLGVGNEYDYWRPMRVPLEDGVVVQQVACGFNHTAAVFRRC
jgi:alpha-tubulin suppressor-like RCC1 family protein